MCRGDPDWRRGAGACAERTWNMYCISVTLDVSRLSGWLNALAFCRVEGEAWEEDNMPAGRLGVGWEAAAQAACRGRSRLETGRRGTGAERTWNMYCMVVTLDVSKLSGWLNACAFCRVQGET